MSYLRSVHVQKDKSIFKLEELPVQRFAESLGLPGAPKIKFLNKEIAKRKKNASHIVSNLESQSSSSKVAGPDDVSSDSDDEEAPADSSSEEEDPQRTAASAPKAEKVRTWEHMCRFSLLTVIESGAHEVRSNVRAQEPKYPLGALHKARRS